MEILQPAASPAFHDTGDQGTYTTSAGALTMYEEVYMNCQYSYKGIAK